MRFPWLSLGCLLAAGPLTAQPGKPTERLLLLDRDASPRGSTTHGGVLFTLDVESGAILAELSHPAWRDPTALLLEPDGSLLVLDYTDSAPGEPPRPGALFRVDAARERVTPLRLPPGLLDPTAMARAPDGSLWILDKNADPRRAGKGTLWRLSRDERTLEILATGPPFLAPAAVVFDAQGALVLDADAGPERSGTLIRVDLEGRNARTVRTLDFALSPLDLVALPDGSWIVVDANRHPEDAASLRGSLARLDLANGDVVPLARNAPFVDPVRGLWHRDGLWIVDTSADPFGRGPDALCAERLTALRQAGRLHGDATPRHLPELLARLTPGPADPVLPVGFGGFGGGALWRVDLTTGAFAVAAASERFVTPIAVVADRVRR